MKLDDLPSSSGEVYTDSSRMCNGHPDTIRLGWAFVAVNENNVGTAIARGTPPSFVEDIPAAEAWALYQATTFASLGT